MPLSEDTKQRILAIASGSMDPVTGMEKHFHRVINGKAAACTPEEKQWVQYINEHRNQEQSRSTTGSSSNSRNQKTASGGATKIETHEIVQKSVRSVARAKTKYMPAPRQPSSIQMSVERSQSAPGYCVDCGTKIPEARLQASPNTRRCVGCQNRMENKNPGIVSRRINEGIGGTREDNKRMRAKDWSDLRNRGK